MPPLERWNPWMRTAAVIWAIVLVAVCARVAVRPLSNNVYVIYSHAGQRWHDDGRVYDPSVPAPFDNFRYAPAMAVFFAYFGQLPDGLGSVLWRLGSAVVFFGGLEWFLRHLGGPLTDLSPRAKGILYLLLLPTAMGSFNNGQVNALVMGLLLIGVTAAHLKLWNRVALCIALVTLCKLYPLALGMLLMLIFPATLIGRVTIAMAAGLLLPFAFGGFEFVKLQYVEWFANLQRDDRTVMAARDGYQDFPLLLRLVGLHLSRGANTVLQLGAGAAVAALLLRARYRRVDPASLLAGLLHLGCIWMALFGPASESATYTLVAPTVACATLGTFVRPSPRWVKAALIASMALFTFRWLALTFPFGKAVAVGVQPLAALLLCVERVAWFWHLPTVAAVPAITPIPRAA